MPHMPAATTDRSEATEGRHTPGPWSMRRGHPYGPDGQPLLIGGKTHEAAANKRLIAAAPDLLEAARAAEQWLSGWASASPYIDALRAAIAKATGEGRVMPPTFTPAEADEADALTFRRAEPLPAPLDPFPPAPSDVWAADQTDRVTMFMLSSMRAINAQLASRHARHYPASYLKSEAREAESYRLDLLKRDVAGAVRRARVAQVEAVATEQKRPAWFIAEALGADLPADVVAEIEARRTRDLGPDDDEYGLSDADMAKHLREESRP